MLIGSPPLAWGILSQLTAQPRCPRITPTCVGNTAVRRAGTASQEDHPHLRGEYFPSWSLNLGYAGSPPLAWGILINLWKQRCLLRITPTCVGNTVLLDGGRRPCRDHPHLRGEYFKGFMLWIATAGSPPLAWGIPVALPGIISGCWITPTCVGNTMIESYKENDFEDHPHLRGEYYLRDQEGQERVGSPPLAWGIQFMRKYFNWTDGITPTCVGNTHCTDGWSGRRRDHPHLRGEYWLSDRALFPKLGSPPLAWGILYKK